MRKAVFALVIFGFLIAFNIEKAGAWGTKKEAAPAQGANAEKPKAAETKKVDKAKESAAAKKKELLAGKMAALNNTQWQIELNPSSAAGKKQVLILTFQNNQVSSTYSAGAFPSSNYTLSYNDDSTLIWETMQTSEKQGVLFWRGEIPQDMNSMRGILSHLLNDKTTRDYSFASIKKEVIAPQE